MKVIEVQVSPWDKACYYDPKDYKVDKWDKVVVKTDLGNEVGTVMKVIELTKEELEGINKSKQEISPIIRKANLSDLQKIQEKESHRAEALETCRDFAKKHNLPMKLVDVRFSFDGGKIIFIFIAKERIDFRELVKDLTHHFQKSVRLQQVNVREETKLCGKVGPCGRELCCARFLKELGNITLEKAQDQQIIHWGPERLSGVCGRLKCCLLYEEDLYKDLAKNLPAIGSTVKTKSGTGKVVGWHILKQSVDVEVDKNTVVEVPIEK